MKCSTDENFRDLVIAKIHDFMSLYGRHVIDSISLNVRDAHKLKMTSIMVEEESIKVFSDFNTPIGHVNVYSGSKTLFSCHLSRK